MGSRYVSHKNRIYLVPAAAFSLSCFLFLTRYALPESGCVEKLETITVKPHYSKQHQNLKIVSVLEGCPLHKGFSQIDLICFKSLLERVMVSGNQPQSVSRGLCWKKEPKGSVLEDIMFI